MYSKETTIANRNYEMRTGPSEQSNSAPHDCKPSYFTILSANLKQVLILFSLSYKNKIRLKLWVIRINSVHFSNCNTSQCPL